jgi:hypothetical protein
MLWIYHRDGQELRVEVLAERVDGRYALRVCWPDGREQFETFASEGPFRRRLLEFESFLCVERWARAGDRSSALPERRGGVPDRRRITRRDRRAGNSAAGASEERTSNDDAANEEDG